MPLNLVLQTSLVDMKLAISLNVLVNMVWNPSVSTMLEWWMF
ncbi:hypothetical protein COP2_006977 [Malus domestica]